MNTSRQAGKPYLIWNIIPFLGSSLHALFSLFCLLCQVLPQNSTWSTKKFVCSQFCTGAWMSSSMMLGSPHDVPCKPGPIGFAVFFLYDLAQPTGGVMATIIARLWKRTWQGLIDIMIYVDMVCQRSIISLCLFQRCCCLTSIDQINRWDLGSFQVMLGSIPHPAGRQRFQQGPLIQHSSCYFGTSPKQVTI